MGGNHYGCYDGGVYQFDDPDERDEFAETFDDEIEPLWERFYDERDDYEGCRDEVER